MASLPSGPDWPPSLQMMIVGPVTFPGLCFLIGRGRDFGQMNESLFLDVSVLLGVTVTPKLISKASSHLKFPESDPG